MQDERDRHERTTSAAKAIDPIAHDHAPAVNEAFERAKAGAAARASAPPAREAREHAPHSRPVLAPDGPVRRSVDARIHGQQQAQTDRLARARANRDEFLRRQKAQHTREHEKGARDHDRER